ncbi:MFS transporter [Plantactinospora sp. GCM10030261]|uniref:MFS transporter n=1 Tax=Plantactinospora sp. GCM10030261 TaxID=3273420 RepID=UPI00361CE7CB
MSTVTEPPSGTWRDLLGPGHVGTSVVLAGGVGLHAINIFLTTSLLPTAIDEIGGERLYAWSTSVFMIASVISSMLVSRLLGGRGPTMAYLIALAPFIAGTLLCAVSPTMEVLLLGRALQGVGGGILAGLGYAVVQAVLPENLWAKATALVSAMWGVGTLAGPAIGGLFAQFAAWRMAFVVLAVIGALVAVLATRVLPNRGGSEVVEPMPVLSLALLTGTTVVISVASLLTRPGQLVAAGLVAASLLVAFVVWERRGPARVLPATTYAANSPLRWLYLTIAILAAGTATEAFTPLFGQRLGGLEPLAAGFLGAAVSVGWSTSMIFSANVSDPRIVRRLRVLGPAVLAVGLAVTGLGQREDAGALTIATWFIGLIVAGVGIGIAFPHLIVATMSVSGDSVAGGKAAAGANTVELVALSLSSALGGVLVNLGAPSMVRSAQFVLVGFAVLAVLGCLTVRRANRADTSATSRQAAVPALD